MAQRGMVLATKPDDSNLIPVVPMVEEESRLKSCLPSSRVCFDTLLSTLQCKVDG